MKITLIYNQKGGVAKTSLATEIAGNFAAKGMKTLLIDYDGQGNVAQTFDVNLLNDDGPSRDVFVDFVKDGKKSFKDHVTTSIKGERNLDALFGGGSLSMIDVDISMKLMEQEKIGPRKIIKGIREMFEYITKDFEYEHIVLDSSPTLGLFQGMLMSAVDEVIIPSEMSKFSQKSIIQVYRNMKRIEETLKLEKRTLINKIKFVVPTKLENTINNREIYLSLAKNLPKITGVEILPWEEGVPKATAFADVVRKQGTTPILVNSKNKATAAITNIVEKYLI